MTNLQQLPEDHSRHFVQLFFVLSGFLTGSMEA
jgi:peptidoglycan/LPS O-acetylase OafA/YrhL